MFWMLIHPSSGACDLFVELFHGLYCSGSMCVGVTLWFGWGGVVSGCRLKHSSQLHVPDNYITLDTVTYMMTYMMTYTDGSRNTQELPV